MGNQRSITAVGSPPAKRVKTLLDDSDSDSEAENLNINEQYAKRFEHNKKREELQRLQEKYGDSVATLKTTRNVNDPGKPNDGSESSTDSEDEDDEGVLASTTLDTQIQETLAAIRSKDPRVYDKDTNFFPSTDPDLTRPHKSPTRQSKPLYLRDYHRNILLAEDGFIGEQSSEPQSYAQQQNDLKHKLVEEMHTPVAAETDETAPDGSNDEADNFLVTKNGAGSHTEREEGDGSLDEVDIENADKDPEAYLSKFMSARAWVPTKSSRFQPFESDDEEEERRAEEFEAAYNMRFEDPSKSNEKLVSHARDVAAKHSVRKESLNPRKRAREAERAKQEAAKQTEEQEKARLRKLKVSEMEEKIQKIREAGGLRTNSLNEQKWSEFLEEMYSNERWEEEMQKRFGDDYYAQQESGDELDGIEAKRKLKKPKWDEDIDIDDLVPDFDQADEEEHSLERPPLEAEEDGGVRLPNRRDRPELKHTKELAEQQKKKEHLERRKIERLVDEQLQTEYTLSKFGKKHAGNFRYRETSPLAFGLTPQDILMASDSQLNQHAGLKKMAAFRDSSKKLKDKKRLGKKARLREWRKETFGDDQGPKQSFAEMLGEQDGSYTSRLKHERGPGILDIREGKGRKRRGKGQAA